MRMPNVHQDQEPMPTLPPQSPLSPPTHVRKVVLGLTIAAYMITYVDRVIMSVTIPSIQKDLGFSLVTMGTITLSFRLAYFFPNSRRMAR